MTRALITSGGGAKGAFTVGALKFLKDKGIDKFDIISGNSTGSLVSILAASGEYDLMEHIYETVTNDDILKKENIVDNILQGKPFIYDTDPLLKTIDANFSDAMFERIMSSAVRLCLTTISLQTGRITVFCTKHLPSSVFYDVRVVTTKKELIDAALASSSQAGFLKPVEIKSKDAAGNEKTEQFVDGGNRDVIPTRVAADLQPDEIYVISNNPSELFAHDQPFKSVMEIILRAISIFVQEVRENDMAILQDYQTRNLNTRIFRIEPQHDLDPVHTTGLNFNTSQMTIWKSIGKDMAKQALQTGGRVIA